MGTCRIGRPVSPRSPHFAHKFGAANENYVARIVRLQSVATLDNVQLVARSRLVRQIGSARASTLDAICIALSIAAGCEG